MINNVVLMGRLVSKPELKTSQSGLEVTSFAVAVDKKFKNKDGSRDTNFINCVAWRQTAKFIVDYFDKGQMIAVEGSIDTRSYENKNGQKVNVVEIVVESASFCGDGKKPESTPQTPPAPSFNAMPKREDFPKGEQGNDQYVDALERAGAFDGNDSEDELPF